MKHLLLGLVLGTLVACGGGASSEQAAQAPAPRQETVFDPMAQQLDRAKQVADTLPKERKENLDNAIDADSN
jgi:hypothetical protein